MLQGIVDQLNDPGALPTEAACGDRLEALLVEHGFVVNEWLHTEYEQPEWFGPLGYSVAWCSHVEHEPRPNVEV